MTVSPPPRLDSLWLRWPVVLMLMLFPFSLLALSLVSWPVLIVWPAFFAALIAYSAHLLFRRLQCSLLEWCLVIFVLGNLEALFLTTPGILSSAMLCGLLSPVIAVGVFYGALRGLAQAQLMGITRPTPRILLLCANWYTLSAPAMVLLVAAYAFGPDEFQVIGQIMSNWIVPLLVFGVAGLVLRWVLAHKSNQCAKNILRPRL